MKSKDKSRHNRSCYVDKTNWNLRRYVLSLYTQLDLKVGAYITSHRDSTLSWYYNRDSIGRTAYYQKATNNVLD